MLSKDTCKHLIVVLREQHQNVEGVEVTLSADGTEKKKDRSNSARLQVVTIKVLLKLLGNMVLEDVREVNEV